METISQAAKNLDSQLKEWYRELHRIPEIGHDLPKTAAVVVRELSKLGLDEIKSQVGKFEGQPAHGVVATLKGKKPGKTLAIRADMDALPMKETTGLTYASENEYMHSCGHDAHTSMLLGVAKLLVERKEELSGEIRFIFQPAEEILQGAIAMINDGVLDGVDAIIGMHTSSLLWPFSKPGVIGWRSGPTMAASDEMAVEFRGKGAHGASPHMGVDTILMASEAVCRLQKIVSREVDPLDTAVITVGAFHGGTVCNIIPETCNINATIRTLDLKTREFVLKRAAEIVEDTAQNMRGSAKITYPISCMPVVNDPALTRKAREIIGKELGEDMLEEMTRPLMGGEDFSFYMAKVPGVFIFHSANFRDERDLPHHNPNFQLNESAFWTGTAALTSFAMEWQNEKV